MTRTRYARAKLNVACKIDFFSIQSIVKPQDINDKFLKIKTAIFVFFIN